MGSDEIEETEEGDDTQEFAADDSTDTFADMLMDKLADKLLDFGLNHYAEGLEDAPDTAEDDQLDEGELGEVEDYLPDEVQDDQLDEDSLTSVLGLRGGAAMKAMEAMKAMKAMKVSKIAKGKRAKSQVFRGTKEKTEGGLTKSDLVKSTTGKIVSKKMQAKGKALYAKYGKKWNTAVQQARKALGLKGFVAVKKGTPLYTKAKALAR